MGKLKIKNDIFVYIIITTELDSGKNIIEWGCYSNPEDAMQVAYQIVDEMTKSPAKFKYNEDDYEKLKNHSKGFLILLDEEKKLSIEIKQLTICHRFNRIKRILGAPWYPIR